MGLADERKPVNLMTVHVSKSVTVHEVSNTYLSLIVFAKDNCVLSYIEILLYFQQITIDCLPSHLLDC